MIWLSGKPPAILFQDDIAETHVCQSNMGLVVCATALMGHTQAPYQAFAVMDGGADLRVRPGQLRCNRMTAPLTDEQG
jgi:hypothetical protein